VLKLYYITAKDMISIFISLVYIDIQLEIIKYIGFLYIFFAIVSRTDKSVV